MEKTFQFDTAVNQIKLEVKNSDEALKKISSLLYSFGYVKDTYSDAIIAREKLFPTGLPFEKCGVALPHTDCCHVNKPMIAICTLKTPVTFQNMGDASQPVSVKIIFMLAMKKSENQLQLLSELMENLQDNMLMENLLQTDSAKEITALMAGRITV
ncbi:PTS sugar transporter subunit IIA [Pectinatus haikarae]|uniref:PTS system galactitol-specific IIA component n=1 Tax=Pectinatus haikarae TaxID=349096 RepID=A0ABT9YB87_9FIRM|nr:PTS sugar transporter subunit IIA [Pectinatus haikarae]MDQ0205116.1 PTS system galactitol-specific IIA component [Pectinatus haikarae]